MARGISVHVGINVVNPAVFSAPNLRGCENDAREMHKLARSRGFLPAVDPDAPEAPDAPILGEQATFKNVVRAVEVAAGQLKSGEIFLFTFAGHGGRKTDRDGDESLVEGDASETDFKDETIVLSDLVLLDDFLRRGLWPKFAEGVRILMVSDSCHSGSIFMNPAGDAVSAPAAAPQFLSDPPQEPPPSSRLPPARPRPAPVRELPEFAGRQHFALENLKEVYRKKLEALPANPAIGAKLLLLAACEDREKTPDGDPHGVFTQALLDVLKNGGAANYSELRDKIELALRAGGHSQHPQLKPHPKSDTEFAAQPPFAI